MDTYRTIRPRSRRRPARLGCLLVWLFLAGGLGFLLLRAHNGVTLTVGAHPTIIADECGGAVIVQAGPARQVTFSGVFPQYSQDTSTDTIELTQCDGGITMTVPPLADLTIHTTDAMTVFGVSGTLNLDTNGSRITLVGVTLAGASRVSDNGGPIVFRGDLSAGSASVISDNGGSIDMTLPAGRSFHLKFSGILGPLVTHFPGVQVLADPASGMQFNVGDSSSTRSLTLDVNDTAVILQGVEARNDLAPPLLRPRQLW